MNFDISKLAYELYKRDWITRNVTKNDMKKTLIEYLAYHEECLDFGDDTEYFEEWIFDNGYDNSSLYVCYEEFLGAEYRDADYIRGLLDDDELFMMYCEDVADED